MVVKKGVATRTNVVRKRGRFRSGINSRGGKSGRFREFNSQKIKGVKFDIF